MANNFSDRRVVVTGMGVVTPLGHDLETFWKNLIAGACGIDKISAFDAAAFDTKIAGEVRDFDPFAGVPLPQGSPPHGPLFAVWCLRRLERLKIPAWIWTRKTGTKSG
jgi:3-oxoacyl-(acyl-carrier-protein) synthase